MIDCLDDNRFKTSENSFSDFDLINRFYKCCITIELI